ncbi:uncharacterized protein BDZ83DRAFT_614493, partial [Colletotrichum acutatum]
MDWMLRDGSSGLQATAARCPPQIGCQPHVGSRRPPTPTPALSFKKHPNSPAEPI